MPKDNLEEPKPNDDTSDADLLYEEQFLLSEEDLHQGHSYCMACDAPLKRYNSLICFECLDDQAEMFANMIGSKEEPKTIYVDFDYISPLEDEDSNQIEESVEKEWDKSDEEDEEQKESNKD